MVEPVQAHFLWRPQLRDPNDEMVLEAAINGSATHLVSFNLRDFDPLKTHVIEMLYSTPTIAVVRKLQQLFLSNPVSVRKERIVPRRKPSSCRSYHFQRRVKKIVF